MPNKAVAEMERLRLLVEGVNNKIRVLQRRAYGYRDEEYLKLKIVAAPSSVGEMTLRLYGALSYSQNSACDLRRALNGA